MTDLEDVNPFAAPKQPTISLDPTIGDPIPYEATPTIDDLNSALRPISAIIPSIILLSMMMLCFVLMSFSLFIEGLKSSNQILLLFGSLIFGSLTAVHLFSQLFAGKIHLRSNPDATAPLKGELTNDGLRLQRQDSVVWQPHSGIVFCHCRNDQVVISNDPFKKTLKILPARGFYNSDLAIRFLEFQATKNAHPTDLAQPLTGPSMVGDPPVGVITFAGAMQASDIAASPLEKIRKRKIYVQLIWRFVLYFIGLPVVALAFGWTVALYAGAALFMLDFSKLQSLLGFSSSPVDPEQPLVAIQGWMNDQEVTFLHNIEHSRSSWQEFQIVGANEACIWIQPNGMKDRFVLLPKRIFSDDTQWQAAVDIVATQKAKKPLMKI